jgi:hypothetical protein
MFTVFNPLWSSIIFFLACIVVLHILFIWIFPQDEAIWKRVDYIWLGLACIGILTATADVRCQSAKTLLPQIQSWPYNDFSILYGWVKEYQIGSIYDSSRFVKTADSPSDFDEMNKQYDYACELIKAVDKALPELETVKEELMTIRVEDLPDDSHITAGWPRKVVNNIKMHISNYEYNHQRFESTRLYSEPTELELLLFYINPYIIGLALAIRITKVSGELSLLKQKIAASNKGQG